MTTIDSMTVRPSDLVYPVLCLSRRAGITVVRSPEEFGRSSAALVWRGGFYAGLRVVDAAGAAYDVVTADVVRPRSAAGRALARLLGAGVRVAAELRPAGPAALDELRARVRAEVEDDPEALEEMTGRAAAWWHEALARCADAGAVVRAVDAAARTG